MQVTSEVCLQRLSFVSVFLFLRRILGWLYSLQTESTALWWLYRRLIIRCFCLLGILWLLNSCLTFLQALLLLGLEQGYLLLHHQHLLLLHVRIIHRWHCSWHRWHSDWLAELLLELHRMSCSHLLLHLILLLQVHHLLLLELGHEVLAYSIASLLVHVHSFLAEAKFRWTHQSRFVSISAHKASLKVQILRSLFNWKAKMAIWIFRLKRNIIVVIVIKSHCRTVQLFLIKVQVGTKSHLFSFLQILRDRARGFCDYLICCLVSSFTLTCCFHAISLVAHDVGLDVRWRSL